MGLKIWSVANEGENRGVWMWAEVRPSSRQEAGSTVSQYGGEL